MGKYSAWEKVSGFVRPSMSVRLESGQSSVFLSGSPLLLGQIYVWMER